MLSQEPLLCAVVCFITDEKICSVMGRLLAINGSPRANGTDSEIIKIVSEMAKKYNYETEVVNLFDLRINDCRACLACKKTGKCAQKDDMTPLYDKMRSADMILLASPIYFGAETGVMRCFVDRFYAMIGNDNGKRTVDKGTLSKASVLLSCGDPEGDMHYGGVLARMTGTMKSLNIIDVSGAIIPGISPKDAASSEHVKKYIDTVDFQLEM